MTSSLFGSSGIRQIADRKLLELALKVGMCLGAEYKSVITGRDTRTSGEAIKKALEAGLMFSGSEVSDAGTVPTPTLAYAGRRFTLGIMVTASHNPPQYNGIKIFNPDGSAFDAVQRQNLEATLSKNDFCSVGWQKMGKGLNYPGAVEEHKKAILSHLKLGAGLKIVLDCGCGAASVISPGLFKKAGCEVIELNCSASGFFPRPSEPSPENIGQLAERVISSGA
ncbi:MAG: phosphoglucosamine mutase, partial [Dehalococcoidia bacterium]|nr:phosphoglucosamine mutase [Dehalococcoidia bacterium]